MLAIKSEAYDVIEYLFSRGKAVVDIKAKDRKGWTAFLYACANSRWGTVSMLLKHGANIKDVSKHANSALMIAIDEDHTAIIKLLKAAGAK